MKITLALTLLLFTGLAIAQPAKDDVKESPKMSAEERSKALQLLKDSQKEFLDSVEKLTDAQWNFKSPPIDGRERWSIAETAEHIMLSEGLIFGAVEAAMAAPADADWQAKTGKKTAFVTRVLPDRSTKATAPEAIQPRSNLTRAQVIARYKEMRAKTLKFAETTDAALKEHLRMHPMPVFGELNAYQWMIYVPLHNIRHNQQIAEVKTYAGYPK